MTVWTEWFCLCTSSLGKFVLSICPNQEAQVWATSCWYHNLPKSKEAGLGRFNVAFYSPWLRVYLKQLTAQTKKDKFGQIMDKNNNLCKPDIYNLGRINLLSHPVSTKGFIPHLQICYEFLVPDVFKISSKLLLGIKKCLTKINTFDKAGPYFWITKCKHFLDW